MTGTVISYPIPAYQNLPIDSDFYQPSRFLISAITLGLTTVVTTTVDHNYVVGQLVRLLIPPQFGTIQLNNQTGIVISIPASTQVTININSQFMDAFINANVPNKAQIIAIGDNNSGIISDTGRVISSTNIPGSFINISPQ